MKFVISDSTCKLKEEVEIDSVNFDLKENSFYFLFETHNQYSYEFQSITNFTFIHDTVHIVFDDKDDVLKFKEWLIKTNDECLKSW